MTFMVYVCLRFGTIHLYFLLQKGILYYLQQMLSIERQCHCSPLPNCCHECMAWLFQIKHGMNSIVRCFIWVQVCRVWVSNGDVSHDSLPKCITSHTVTARMVQWLAHSTGKPKVHSLSHSGRSLQEGLHSANMSFRDVFMCKVIRRVWMIGRGGQIWP